MQKSLFDPLGLGADTSTGPHIGSECSDDFELGKAAEHLVCADLILNGYVLAIAMQIVVFPCLEIETVLSDHLAIGLAFVGVSLVRGYPR